MNCPICNSKVETKYAVTSDDGVATDWLHCLCGTVFHTKGVDKKYFNDKYLKDWQGLRGLGERYEYLFRVYLPVIEELTYGRKFLDVGFTLPFNMKILSERGWIASGIDLINNNFIVGDFEKFDFKDKFDFINMGHCLESFENPFEALKKAHEILDFDGLLLITTPNPELIFNTGLSKFGHWQYKEKHILISKYELEKMAERAGFNIILSRRNFSQRFIMFNDLHLLLQRRD